MRQNEIQLQQVEVNGRERPSYALPQFVTEIFLLFGLQWFCFPALASITERIELMIFGVIILAFFQIGSFHREWEMFLYPAAAVLCVALLVIRRIDVAKGLLTFINRLLENWNVSFDRSVPYFSVPGGMEGGVFFFLLLFTLIAAVWVDLLVSRRWRVAATVMAVILLPGAAFLASGATVPASIIFVFLGWIGLLVLSALENGGIRFFAAVLLPLCVFVLAGGLLCTAAAPSVAFLRKTVTQKVEKWRYGEDTLPEGDLTKENGLHKGDTERLQVETNGYSALYLKGFVGADYKGTSWQSLRRVNYSGDNSGMLAWLQAQGLTVQRQYSAYLDAEQAGSGQSADALFTLKIDNVGADRRYAYAPTTVQRIGSGDSTAQMDWQFVSSGLRGQSHFEYICENNVLQGEEMTAAPVQDQTFASASNVYQNFVYKNYLGIEPEMKELIDKVFYGDDTWSDTGISVSKVTSRIRTVLSAKEEYVDEPDKAAVSDDKIRQFLLENHTGNAVSFASAAVMAFRAQNIPARYVEGYYVQEAGEEERTQGSRTVTLTTKNAHAWVEVYQDLIGWVPVEITPGYYAQYRSGRQVIPIPIGEEGEDGVEGILQPSKEEDAPASTSFWWGGQTAGERVMALVLLVVLVLVLVLFVLELQRFIRRRCRLAKEKKAAQKEKLRLWFRHMMLCLAICQVPGNASEPESRGEELVKHCPSISQEAYEQTVRLMQQVFFGGHLLEDAEVEQIEKFVQELSQAAAHDCGNWLRRIYCRYRHAV